MKTTHIARGIAALGLTLAAAACSDALNLKAAGDLAMTMQRADTSASIFGSPPQNETQNRAVAPDTVKSFRVTITAVSMLHAGFDSNAGQWATVQLRAPITLDLMAMPTTSDSAFVFASGQVEAGSYSAVRLTIANPQIAFKGSVGFGVGGTLQGNTDYAVQLQGASSSTIQTSAPVTVQSSSSGSAQSSLHLVFDQHASLGSVSAAGSGTVLLNAVIGSR